VEPNEYDPERGLWVMGRRRFFCFSAAAAVGVMLPSSTFHPDYFQIVVPMPQLEVVPVASMARAPNFFRQGVSFALDYVEPSGPIRVVRTRVSPSDRMWRLSDDGKILWRRHNAPEIDAAQPGERIVIP